jgi:simple sugar transport system permease protein
VSDVATVPPPAAEEQPPDTEHLSFGKRLWYAYLYGSTPVLVVLAFVLALVIGAILIAVSDEPTRNAMGYFTQHPSDTFSRGWHAIASAYSQLFEGSIFNPNSLYSNSGVAILNPISDTLTNATPLILTGLAVGLAFRAGLFNIGGQGQIIAGAICAGYVGFAWSLPPGLHVIVAVLAGAIGGAVWGGIAGLLKAATGAHEVITTIMLNYVAFYLLSYLLGLGGFQKPNSNEAISRTVHSSALLPHLLGSNQKLRVNVGLLIAIAAAVVCWWLLTRSTLGFRLRAVGANHLAARTAGMSVANSYLVVMLIAGALAGLAGATQVMGVNTSLNQSIDAGIGFDAITVALLGFASPGGIVAAGLLFGAFRAGSVQLLVNTTTPQEIVDVIQAVIVLFIAAPGLIRTIFRLRAARAGRGAGQLAKGWNG